jgi:hypothetical protein
MTMKIPQIAIWDERPAVCFKKNQVFLITSILQEDICGTILMIGGLNGGYLYATLL